MVVGSGAGLILLTLLVDATDEKIYNAFFLEVCRVEMDSAAGHFRLQMLVRNNPSVFSLVPAVVARQICLTWKNASVRQNGNFRTCN